MPPDAQSGDRPNSSPGSPLPAISLPKGGGAIQGIGEKFSTNAMTGTGTVTVPIAVSPGRAGFGPALSLNYDSGTGNGVFGVGWRLPLQEIVRKTEKGLPLYRDGEESDVFILAGHDDLVPCLRWIDGSGWQRVEMERDGFRIRRYRPRVEGVFARIERWTRLRDGDMHWRAITKDNVLTIFGDTPASRIHDPRQPSHIFKWLVASSYDGKGNAIVYHYDAEDLRGVDRSLPSERHRGAGVNRYLKRILYGNRRPLRYGDDDARDIHWMFELVFDYGDEPGESLRDRDGAELLRLREEDPDRVRDVRPDPFSTWRSGYEIRTWRLCRRALMFHRFPTELGEPRSLVRSTEFHYDAKPIGSLLTAVVQSGYTPAGGDRVYRKTSLPPLEFGYTPSPLEDADPGPFETRDADARNLPEGIDGARYRWIDLDGEGIAGVLTEQGGGWYFKRNLGDGCFGTSKPIAHKPVSARLGTATQQFLDVGGEGQSDLVDLTPGSAGFYERASDPAEPDGLEAGWGRFRAFRSVPVLNWSDPNLRFVDLTGDGIADILVTEDVTFQCYPSLGRDGFAPAIRVPAPGDEYEGPRVVFSDPAQSIYLADMSGDGLSDIVRVRNGEVCYWPNRGYGRFGGKIVMGSPWFDAPNLFDNSRVRLADTDGSGTTDILYVGVDAIQVYLNQSGNTLSSPRLLRGPPNSAAGSVLVVDFLGRGTACVVWSSPLRPMEQRPLRYVDLMRGAKPHLLTRIANNLGAETRIEYASSTEFYLADRAAGQPWVTSLPFPVHVVRRTETIDLLGRNRFVTTMSYHHGYYDGIEREFRGFGRVDQFDGETFDEIAARSSAIGSNEDVAWRVPPVVTKTWYHTGVFLGADRVSRHLAHEYYRAPGETAGMRLDDTILPREFGPEEAREGCRALKGTRLRQEIYALDGSEAADRPYSVTESNVTMRLSQPRESNRHGVFLVHPREDLTLAFERALYEANGALLADPRVSHGVTLAVDDFGNVLKSASIAYGRLLPDRAAFLTERDRERQATSLATMTEHRYTNLVDTPHAWRTPVLAEKRDYDLVRFPRLAGEADLPRFREIERLVTNAGDGAHELPFEDVDAAGATGPGPYRRLIGGSRTLYRSDDLRRLLPLGRIEALALAGETYTLALTPGLIETIYRARLDHPHHVLHRDCGYVDPDGDGRAWVPSGLVFFSPDPDDDAAAELALARRHFFLPRRFRDPFGNPDFVDYDANDLLIVETRDALNNRITADAQDYRMLRPGRVSDANRNQTEFRFDALGLLVGIAVMGKPAPATAEGDSLNGFVTELTREQRDGFFDAADPRDQARALLRDATSRMVYDVDRFRRTRDAHPNEPGRWQPACVATLSRETHVNAPLPPWGFRLQLGFTYSDGFGREIQQKIQCEPGPLVAGETVRDPRWVGSGWTIFNNKGKPVRQFEPFFSATHQFEFDVRAGVGPVLFYDPTERVVAILQPNNVYEKVTFDPWRQTTYDVNDTCAPRDGQTGDPRTDPDISFTVARYFGSLAAAPPGAAWRTWYEQRIGGALGPHEQAAAARAAAHADTPSTVYFDPLGRPFLTVTRNRVAGAGHDLDGTEATLLSRVELDIVGNQRAVRDAVQQAGDALGRVVMRYDYDMTGKRIHQVSMEAGARWMLNDVAGKAIRTWDSRGHEFRVTYDALRRPIGQYVRGTTAESDPRTLNRELLVDKIEYGEGIANAEALNLRTRVYRHFDSAGIVTNARLGVNGDPREAYDFKGNLSRGTRRFVNDHRAIPDWRLTPTLEAESFEGSTRYDALNRVTQSIAPHSSLTRARHNIIQPVFNEASLLERLDVWLERVAEPVTLLDPALDAPSAVGVANIDYDAKGRRQRIDYRNGAGTFYDYDPLTFRLTQLRTRRGAGRADDREHPLPFPPGIATPDSPAQEHGRGPQDLRYTYDPIGNITHIQDGARQTIFFRNQRVEPSNDYIYDALYRLIQATGREHLGQTNGVPNTPTAPDAFDSFRRRLDQPGDGNAMGRYVERYVYDAVGNFLRMRHRGGDPANAGWTRAYDYAEASLIEDGNGGTLRKTSNRLSRTTLNPDGAEPRVEPCQYDAHGNMVRMPHLGGGSPGPNMVWDYKDQLRQVDLGGGGAAFYVYDAAGQRVRKVWEKAPGLIEERLYLGGFELFRKRAGPVGDRVLKLERETLHVMDDEQRIALVETRTLDAVGSDPAPARSIRYQFGNHLDSVSLELDDHAKIISYEEYAPYGSSTYQAVRGQTETAKRYRYTGKERDEATGLYYHGARYYAAWLGRWTRTDPIGIEDDQNLYAYVKDRPITLVDRNGRNGVRPEDIISDTTSTAGDRTFYHVVDWRRQAPEMEGYSAVGNQLAGIQREGIRPATSGSAGQFGTGVYAFATEEQARGLAGSARPYAAFQVDPATPVRTITVRLAGGKTNTYTIVAPGETANLRTASLEYRNVSAQQAATYGEALAGATPVPVRSPAASTTIPEPVVTTPRPPPAETPAIPNAGEAPTPAGSLSESPALKAMATEGSSLGRVAGWALFALNVYLALRGAKADYDEGDTVGALLNLSTIGPQVIVTGPLTGSYEGVKAGGELMKMQVDCSEIGMAYEMGDVSVDDPRLHYCMPLLSDQIQRDVNNEYFNGL